MEKVGVGRDRKKACCLFHLKLNNVCVWMVKFGRTDFGHGLDECSDVYELERTENISYLNHTNERTNECCLMQVGIKKRKLF
jgi:hypothetical protein